ncbi:MULTISPECIES: RNA polymerase sigma factor RpoH [Legionella]|uniref:RNA polymerase sigma factor RpoH n=1 Tax=Legionella septentrionalis TaxID=2498109 RepID=A0A3S0VP03_9GAMM|nr:MULTISPECIES: RNA polymerase sigma factor RpoH [Legionella]MCP0914594.1 RNA polymerase sigma factor RpoH [Legionella sp. 27cVA30]RUQ90050.1 RNA polymerase sigma factor RpoH [Legionella septentrionalis]RUQ96180.1 RNA polymerase sigma factor RpoH [Legionella septentrionalis]RUR09342.1 RNA polymerase sigma factor RpoH [Legionella septentrionalis]RUR14292.1 RNA polymerase sigma factor RpoH [Legionella septentrionalis]
MSLQMQLSQMNLPIGSLDAYIHRVNQIPMLSAEEENECARRFREDGDLEGARRLVLAHLRYVVRVARGYLGYGLPLGDLIQEGNIGLMKAVKRFDPSIGVRLVSFAVHWIKAEIHEFVIQNWRIVKIATTKAQRKLFFNMRQMKKRLGWLTNEEVDAVAQDLGVSREDVLIMEQRLNAMDTCYDMTSSEEDDESYKVPANYLHDPHTDPAYLLERQDSNVQGNEKLHVALERLDARSQDILQQRWLVDDKAATLHALAEKYGVSAERVRQLEKNAMKKLRQYMEEM